MQRHCFPASRDSLWLVGNEGMEKNERQGMTEDHIGTVSSCLANRG